MFLAIQQKHKPKLLFFIRYFVDRRFIQHQTYNTNIIEDVTLKDLKNRK